MKKTLLWLGVLLCLLMAGCATDQPPTPVQLTVTKYILLKPSADMVADCKVDSAVPPDAAAYTAATDHDRLEMVKPYLNALQQELTDCASLPSILRTWYAQQEKLVNDTNNPAKSP